MYRVEFCRGALAPLSIGVPRRGHSSYTSARHLMLAVAVVASILCMGRDVDAGEFPRFIATTHLEPLEAALLAYTANALPTGPDERAFGASAPDTAKRYPGNGLIVPRSVRTAPIRQHSGPEVTTQDLQTTLSAARRDAGEARALADQMKKRASEISDRLADTGSGADPVVAPQWHGESVAPSRAATVVPALPNRATPDRASSATQRTSRDPPLGLMSLGAKGTSASQARAAPTSDDQAPALAHKNVPSASLSVPGAIPQTDVQPVTNSAQESVGVTVDPAAAIVKAPAKASAPPTRASTVVDAADSPADAETRQPPRSDGAPMSRAAAAAYGFVPLSRPKDRPTPKAAASVGRRQEHHEPASPLVSSPAQHAPRKAVGRPAGARSATASANAAQDPPAPLQATAEKGSKGLFSWLKSPGKLIDIPKYLSTFGWSSN